MSVSVVIVTYNSRHVIDECLKSVSSEFETVIVDNSSSDGTVDHVRKSHPNITVITNPRNAGFAAAVNTGASATSGEILVLLNPDTQASTDKLDSLTRRLSDNSLGIVGPRYDTPNGSTGLLSAGHFPTIKQMALHFSGWSRLPKFLSRGAGFMVKTPAVSDQRLLFVDWVTGACLVTRRDTWDSLDGLTERWFMYAEDVDYCFRARRSGWEVAVDLSVSIEHRMGTSDGTGSRRMSSEWVTNLLDFFRISISSRRTHVAVWALVVSAGLYSRSLIYMWRSVTTDRNRENFWSAESKRFKRFSIDVLRAIISPT